MIAGSAVAGSLILASSLGVDPAAVIAGPQQAVFRLALLGEERSRRSRWL